jgi:MFS transporter, DHA2 family, multidrug resistance protein
MSVESGVGVEPPAPTLTVWLGFLAMMFGNFMALLDIQIVASSISAIQAGVSASADEISWVQTAYLIAEVIGIPLSGFLGRALGFRKLFCLSAGMFALTSLLCAFSWDITSLITFRALQGFCGAAMIPTSMATMFLVFPRRLQGAAGALVGMVTTMGSVFGPTLGGYVSEALGWRALFWLNVVPGLLVVGLVWNLLRSFDAGQPGLLKRIDVPGLLGLALFLGAAEYVLEEGPSSDWFASPEIWLWASVSAAGAVLFFWRAARAEIPIVDLRPFKLPQFAVGALLSFVVGFTLFTNIFLTPLFLGQVRGYSALQIGNTMFVQGAAMFLTGPVIAGFARQLEDPRLYGLVGFLLVGIASLQQATLTSESSFWTFAVPQALRGIGLLMTFTAVMQPALGALPPHLVHPGSSLFSTTRNLGGAIGIAAITTMQHHAFAMHRQELYSAANASNPQVQGMIAQMRGFLEQTGAADPERQSLMHYAAMLDREALVMTFNDQFLLLSLTVFATAPLMLLMRPTPQPASLAREQAAAH